MVEDAPQELDAGRGLVVEVPALDVDRLAVEDQRDALRGVEETFRSRV